MSRRADLSGILNDPAASLATPDPALRRIAVAASGPDSQATILQMLFDDSSPAVRRECAEVLGRSEAPPVPELLRALASDDRPEVREAAATALGEAADPSAVNDLIRAAANEEEDKLVREAAVAALGATGDERARPVLLQLIASGPPQIRRRCVPALSVFDGDDIEHAIRQAAADRNPMVRDAAELMVGRQPG